MLLATFDKALASRNNFMPNSTASSASTRGKPRHLASVLLISAQTHVLNQLRQAVKSLGYDQISTAKDHVQALERIRSRNFDLVLFDAKSETMPSIDFVKAAVEMDSRTMLIALSEKPRVDDVFGLLRAGARGFIVVPFNTESVESILERANAGPPLSEAILMAPDRNSALISLILHSLYRTCVLARQAREFESASRQLDLQKQNLVETVYLTRLFFDGDDTAIQNAIIDACIERGNRGSSRLTRTRRRLRDNRDAKV